MGIKSKTKFSIIYGLYSGIMPLIMSGLVSFWLYNHVDYFEKIGLVQLLGFTILVSFAVGLSLIPTSFIALASGFFWGLKAIPFLVISYIIATIIGYYLSKNIDNEHILHEINRKEKARKLLENLKIEEFKIIALARLSPIFPFGISNVIFTYLGVKLPKLLLAGIIGMLPRTIFMVWVASKADSLKILFDSNWTEYFKSPLLYFGIFSILILAFIFYKTNKKTYKQTNHG